ncbi:hypothetical protein [Saliphagus infecundisoli]|uniref:Uncharacterized protein n=1 Tax=Saliphagus infecundisoli TaxID=1849069 RepID=A0ABD5QLK4_9EURY|nr:hypothetical protein [Saliphagus infecundisoli]
MTTTVSDLRLAAERLRKALAEYESFLSGWQDANEPLSNDDHATPAEPDATMQEVQESGVAVTNDVLERYHAASDAVTGYVQQTRDQTDSDWSEVIAATEPVRKATLAVHAAGYGTHPETGERDYLLPAELCPARRVSMNAGTSPVTFTDRIAQYRAVANRFGIDADVVYHPGSGHGVSPSVAFPETDVTYVDVDVAAMDDLAAAGYAARWADATTYTVGGGADVIILRNAGLVEEAIVERNLRAGGWVFANDHLESARHVAGMGRIELLGVVPDDWPGDTPRIETTDLDPSHIEREGKMSPQSGSTDWEVSPLDLYVFRESTC